MIPELVLALALQAVPTPYGVTFEWDASAQPPPVDGYRLYCGLTPGGPYPDLRADIPGLTYTDAVDPDGVTRYCIARAYNSAGESGDSNEVNFVPILPPNPPGNLRIAAQGAQVALGFSPVDGATAYDVQIARAGTPDAWEQYDRIVETHIQFRIPPGQRGKDETLIQYARVRGVYADGTVTAFSEGVQLW